MLFTKKQAPMDAQMDAAMLRILDDMEMFGPGTEKYQELLNQLTQMNALRPQANKTISRDTLVTGACHLLGIGLIVAYEQKHVLTSKAQAFIMKLK